MKTSSVPSILSRIKPHLVKIALSTTVLSSSAWGVVTVSTTADSGAGSLRAAITSVNTTPSTPNSIVFTIPASSTITLASSLPAIDMTSTLLIDGSTSSGLTINANNFQPFFIFAGTTVTIQNMTITGAKATGATGGTGGNAGNGGGGGGGGIGAGGGVFVNDGVSVILSNVIDSK